MYHPGKVLRVFSARDADVASSDPDVQAMLSMWDENLITVGVHKNLETQIEEGDIVLVDYSPLSSTVPMPKMMVTKVLRGEHAAETWKVYKEKHKAAKSKTSPLIPFPGSPVQYPPHSYIG